MKWLEKHSNRLFNISGFFLILTAISTVWAMYTLSGIPSNNPSTWTSYQWHTFKFLWIPTFTSTLFYLLLAILCFMKKGIVFPIIFLFMAFSLEADITNLIGIIENGFVYPPFEISGLIGSFTFFLSAIGTILWIWRLRRK